MLNEKQIQLLGEISEGNIENLYDNTKGICLNLTMLVDVIPKDAYESGYTFVRKNSSDWEHFSGCKVYPVRGCKPIDGEWEKIWEGELLELRISLAKHLLSKIE